MEISISQDYFKTKKIMCAVPMYGGQCAGVFARSVMDLATTCHNVGLPMQTYMLFNESLVTRARNYCVDEFMRSDCTHLLFIDSDIGFNPQDVIAMVALMTDDSSYDVMGAPYPKKTISYEKLKLAVEKGFANENPGNLEHFVGDYVFNPLPGATHIPLDQPSEVLEIGTGFMMIQRRVFEKFREAYPETWYKPDHVRTKEFDGSRYISMFFQAEIDVPHEGKFYRQTLQDIASGAIPAPRDAAQKILDDYKVAKDNSSERYLSEDYNFCLSAKSRVPTEDGVKTIKEIVDTKYTGKTLSLSPSGLLEWKPIVGHSVRRNGQRGKPETKKTWVKINTTTDNNAKSKLICTEDHRVFYVDDLFDPSTTSYAPAKEMAGKFVVRNTDDRPIHKENRLYGKDKVSFLVGSLMGDASISKSGQLSMTHCAAQQDYLELKARLFNGAAKRGQISKNGFSADKVERPYVMYAPVNAQTTELRQMAYIDGKRSVKNLLRFVDEKALAFWYMDDGSLSAVGEMRISTESFSYEDHLLIQEYLKERFGIEVVIQPRCATYKGEKRSYFYLRFASAERNKFLLLVAPYIIPCMEYKLPVYLRGGAKFDYSSLTDVDFAASKVKSVTPVTYDVGALYDIEVADNHNFVASGTVVHNCQQIRKIGLRVWFCPWMQTQHVGTHIFGGSLAAMAALQTSATADPALLGKANQQAVRPA